MEKRKNKVLLIGLLAILGFTSGCGISITRNHYYNYPAESVKNNQKKVALHIYPTDTLIIKKNGHN